MNSNGVRTAADAGLLELARTIEQCVPADVERARECLRSLDDAFSAPQEHRRMISSDGRLGPSGNADRLRSLIARLEHDLAGGHVLGVNGLERQIKHYLHTTRS